MAGLKITSFLGIAPKIASELLPDTAAQVARNTKLYSGNLIPYPTPVVAGTTGRSGTVKTLYGLRNPVTSAVEWLSWLTDVNIAVATNNENENQRFYYTGDGVPKVSDYSLATGGSAPFPVSSYDLGLPLPSTVLTTAATTFTTKTSASFARDAGNTATIVTGTAHGLRTGNSITVSGFTFLNGTYNQLGGTTITVTIANHGLANGASVTLDFTSGTATDGTFTITNVTTNDFDIVVATAATTSGDVRLDIRNFNATNVECTVVNPTTFTYFSPGFQIATTANTEGKVDLAGLTQNRTYVYTWYTPWEEESIGSEPSADLFIKEGQTVTVSNLPTAKPSGSNFVRGVRLYRTLASASGTEYFRLTTLWFPTALARVQRTSNVSRVTLAYPHNFGIGDYFKISGCGVPSFDITAGVVTDLIDDYAFEYAQVDADVGDTIVASGTLYHDVSQTPGTTPAQYWGDSTYDFTDDFDSRFLSDTLETDEYDAPPDNLDGLTAMQNNILAGFVANEIYFSEPNRPHAWPVAYKQTIEYNVVGLASANGALLVLTEGYPYIISGSDPAAGLTVQRIDLLYPCLNQKSIVTMQGGVFWSTHDGLAFYSSFGTALVTKFNYNNDTWNTDLDPTTIVASFYGDMYFASYSTGAFTFEREEKVGGIFVDIDYTFSASWYDSLTNKLYYTSGVSGDVFEWDNLTQPPLVQQWKSKTFKTKDMINFGAARVVADYGPVVSNVLTTNWESVNTNWESTTGVYDLSDQITFKFYVDKALVFTKGLSNSNTFRLPTGYRSDTFEFEIDGNIRVREVHIAETPLGLKET